MRRSPNRGVGRPRRAGRVDHHPPLVSDVVIDRGSAWLWMPTFTGSSRNEKPGNLRRLDLATGKVVAGVELLAAAMEARYVLASATTCTCRVQAASR